ncbi:hypothetical protein [Microbacterium enclense]|uniref:hypothetical protein n=1 Tax=Microbacterium enclense TaxID=993073 RepID=UPI003F7DB31A
MAHRLTSVSVPGTRHHGFADYGRKDPVEMIGRLRAMAREEMLAASRVVSAPDSQFVVETFCGVHVQRDRERLWPTAETPGDEPPVRDLAGARARLEIAPAGHWDDLGRLVHRDDLRAVLDVLAGAHEFVVPCACCGQKTVIAADALNVKLGVCGDCGVLVGRELADNAADIRGES